MYNFKGLSYVHIKAVAIQRKSKKESCTGSFW